MTDAFLTDKVYRYYSQYGEDYLLWNFFDFKPEGYFIDIGAFDGVHLSNSYSFEQKGWHGICVEPHPVYFGFCKDRRPASICINKACGGEDRKDVTFNVDNTGLFSSLREIGTEDNIVGHFGLLEHVELKLESIKVDVVTLDSILGSINFNQTLDFISLDVEGAELNVLDGFDLSRYKPRVIVIETNGVAMEKDIHSYLKDNNYYFGRKTLSNSFFFCDKRDIDKINGIEINCLIERQAHPLGIEYTSPAYFSGLAIYEGEPLDVFKALKKNHELAEIITGYEGKVRKLSDWIDEWKGFVKTRDEAIASLKLQLLKEKEKNKFI